MIRSILVFAGVALFGFARLPIELGLVAEQRQLHFHGVDFNLRLREQIGQLGFIAGLSGFRSLVADLLFVEAYGAWERTEWGRVLFLYRQITTLQPRAVLFWDMAAWHMAWNASAACLRDRSQPRIALRIKAYREYLELGKDFLERGIVNNPDRPQLYEALARLYRDKYHDHEQAAALFEKAAGLPGSRSYMKRFAAYELSRCDGRQREAYDRLLTLYDAGEKERVPALIARLKFLEDKLAIPHDHRIPDTNRQIEGQAGVPGRSCRF